jgi:hypothetical protein
MKTKLLTVSIVVLLVAACGRVKLPEGQKSAPYLTVLEQGLTDNIDTDRIPRGEVQIMSELSSKMEEPNATQMRFQAVYLQVLQKAERARLVTLSERPQNALESVGNMGARFFTVTPTDALLKLQDPKKSNDRWIAVPIGTMKVLEILKEEEYKFAERKPGDEFRLVLGRVCDTPTPQAKALASLGVTTEPQDLKFRAVLQLNPFAKTYTYIVADFGKPDESGWSSDFVK